MTNKPPSFPISFSLRQLHFIDSAAQFFLASLDKLLSANQFKRHTRLQQSMSISKKGMSTRTPGGTSRSPSSHQRRPSTIRTMTIPSRSGKPLAATARGTTMTSTFERTCFSLQMCFETFLETCLWQYHLHPVHYYSSPSHSWESLIKVTGVKLELSVDYDQDFNGLQETYQGKQTPGQGLRPGKAHQPHFILGCKQPVWLGHVVATTNRQIWQGGRPCITLFHNCQPPGIQSRGLHKQGFENPAKLHKAHNAYLPGPKSIVAQKEWMAEYQYNLLRKGQKVCPQHPRHMLHHQNLQLYISLGKKVQGKIKDKCTG